MAAYPSFPQLLESRARPTDNLDAGRASNGDLHVRVLSSAQRQQFEIAHLLDAIDRATLDSFYSSNRGAAVDLYWQLDGATYSVYLTEPPEHEPVGRGLVRTRVTAEEA